MRSSLFVRHPALLAASVMLGFFLTAAVAHAGPKAYVGLFKENAVAVIDTADNRLLGKIAVPPGPHGLVVTPDGGRVYVSSDGDSKVSVIDTASDTVTASIDVGKSPHGLAITPDGSMVLAAVFGESRVAFIETATNTVVGTTPVASPHNIAIRPDGRTAYVASQKKGSFALALIDLRMMRASGSVPLAKMPRALSVSPDGSRVFFTLGGSDDVQVLDAAKIAVVAQIPVGVSPHFPLFTADGSEALVVCQGPGELDILDPSRDTVEARVAVGAQPHWIAVTPDGREALVTDEGSNDVSVVDLKEMKTVATIAVGNGPRKIVVQPTTSQAARAAPAAATSISGFAFADTITVAAGQAVTWTNLDPVPHTVTADDGSWGSVDLAKGQGFTMTFSRPGTYAYHCTIHPSMEARVVVSGTM